VDAAPSLLVGRTKITVFRVDQGNRVIVFQWPEIQIRLGKEFGGQEFVKRALEPLIGKPIFGHELEVREAGANILNKTYGIDFSLVHVTPRRCVN
jgi:hypothetical protein